MSPLRHKAYLQIMYPDVCFRGDSVEKVLFGRRTRFLRTADAFRTRRREGPLRFTQNQPPGFVSALRSVAAVETANNQLSRDFQCGSIFDFFNSIGRKAKYSRRAHVF